MRQAASATIKVYKREFATKLTWPDNGKCFNATIRVNASGWGEAFDEDGHYCGSINPIRRMQLEQQTREAKV